MFLAKDFQIRKIPAISISHWDIDPKRTDSQPARFAVPRQLILN